MTWCINVLDVLFLRQYKKHLCIIVLKTVLDSTTVIVETIFFDE